MRLKIFSCHHRKPEFTCNTEIFQTLVSDLPAPDDGSFISDLGGINIADNHRYAELRQQFFVWQNLLDCYDYVGFEHDRRPFFIDPLPANQLAEAFANVWEMRLQFAAGSNAGLQCEPNIFQEYLEMRRSLHPTAVTQVKQWIDGYDIIVPRPSTGNIEQLWKAWRPDGAGWDTMVEAVNRTEAFRARPNLMCFQLEVCQTANMYIMRCDLLNEYLTFCFEVLAFCQSCLQRGGRAPDYIAERLFSIWLYQKRIETPTLRVLELPFLMLH
jgi:uncharacterized protein DUF4422